MRQCVAFGLVLVPVGAQKKTYLCDISVASENVFVEDVVANYHALCPADIVARVAGQ